VVREYCSRFEASLASTVMWKHVLKNVLLLPPVNNCSKFTEIAVIKVQGGFIYQKLMPK
jgi:hypothetical protein